MPLFRCIIRGDNFPGKLLQQDEPVGFYTTRFVEAGSPEQAETLALELLRTDEILAVAPDLHTADAQVFVEHIEEVPLETERKSSKGFTFFTMGT